MVQAAVVQAPAAKSLVSSLPRAKAMPTGFTMKATVDQSRGALKGTFYANSVQPTEAEFLGAQARAELEARRREWAANELSTRIAGLTYGRY
jgi:hypothetical protein